MAIVERLADAQVGDEVWVFDSTRRRFEIGQFVGYGHWFKATVDGVTRKTVSTTAGEFKKKLKKSETNGGFKWGKRLFGARDRADFEILCQRASLAEAVRELETVETLLKVAEIVGFSFKSS